MWRAVLTSNLSTLLPIPCIGRKDGPWFPNEHHIVHKKLCNCEFHPLVILYPLMFSTGYMLRLKPLVILYPLYYLWIFSQFYWQWNDSECILRIFLQLSCLKSLCELLVYLVTAFVWDTSNSFKDGLKFLSNLTFYCFRLKVMKQTITKEYVFFFSFGNSAITRES